MKKLLLLLGINSFVCYMVFGVFIQMSFFSKEKTILFVLGCGVWGVFALIIITIVMITFSIIVLVYVKWRVWKSGQTKREELIILRKRTMNGLCVLLIPHTLVCIVFLLLHIPTIIIDSVILLEYPANIFLCLVFFGGGVLIRNNVRFLSKLGWFPCTRSGQD